MSNRNKSSKSYYMKDEIHTWLDTQAEKEERSASSLLSSIVRLAMKRARD